MDKGLDQEAGLHEPEDLLYVNGNNLFLITKMPDDRESNYGFSGGGGAYPTVRRYNFGIKLYI